MAGNSPNQQVKPGDRLKISARKWNQLGDLLGDKRAGAGLRLAADTETRILVHNNTDADLAAFSVVKVGDVVILPTANESEFTYKRIFEGESPVAGETFAITQEPIKADGYGFALILGVTTATLNVADAADTHATPADDDTDDLATGTSGEAIILWKESGTGAGKRAKVLLLGQAAGSSTGGGTFGIADYTGSYSTPITASNEAVVITTGTIQPGTYLFFPRLEGTVTASAGTVTSDCSGALDVASGTAVITPAGSSKDGVYFRLGGPNFVSSAGGGCWVAGECMAYVVVTLAATFDLYFKNAALSQSVTPTVAGSTSHGCRIKVVQLA